MVNFHLFSLFKPTLALILTQLLGKRNVKGELQRMWLSVKVAQCGFSLTVWGSSPAFGGFVC